MKELYQVFDEEKNEYIAPDNTNPDHALHQFVSNDKRTYMRSDGVIDIRAYLEVNYIFLDTAEREHVVYKAHDVLIEQTMRHQRFYLSEINILELILQNPVKEFIWVLQRDDVKLTNTWFDFTDNNTSIMQSGKIIFNGMDRIDEKDYGYFQLLQPFQHHRTNVKDGVYVYSFSLDADDPFQHSGACNMSRINKIQIMLSLIKPLSELYRYNLSLYTIHYNFLSISNGLAGVAFSN